MGTYPWGPHGPQSGPNQVTPNPTPAYVPPPSAPTPYYAPRAGGPVAYGSGQPVAYMGPTGPRRKHYILALPLTLLFGPLGLFYATKKGALLMLFLLFAGPITLGMLGMLPGGSAAHPLAILDHDAVMDPIWSLSVTLSSVWAVVAVWRHNARVKAES